MPAPTDLPPDNDNLFVTQDGPEPGPSYASRRHRATEMLVTIAGLIVLCAICAYLLLKW